jgi:multidrug efflux pump
MTGALETILSRPRTVLTMMVVMVVAGILTYINIPKEANPDIDVPVYYVSITQQGVSPQDAERLLVRPMETELRGLEGLKEITAIASQGHAGIIVEFNIGTDKDKVLADIRDKVNIAQAELPQDAEEPAIFATNLALQPTIIVTLSGNVPERTMYNYIKKLQDEVEAISSVREANLRGTREEQFEVLLDLEKLESYDITQQELLNSISQFNSLVPAGFIDDGNARFKLEVPGLIENAQDVYAIPIKQNDEGVVTLGEIADIRRGFKDASSYTRVNGKPAMSLEVVKRIGTNIIENNSEVRKVVDNFTKDWPSAIKVTYMIDQSSFIFEVLGSLQSSIMTAVVLVMIIVVASLGVGSGLLVGLAIPASFMIGFLILSAVGLTVNMMVMFGMVLTVGMLVDGAIVVTEYATRKIDEGMAPNEAYPRAAKLMFWPVVSSTATTLAAFLPLLLWPGVPGEFMSYLPIMVIIVLSASLITALIFLPTTGVLFANIGALAKRHARIIKTLLMTAGLGFVGYNVGGNGLDFLPAGLGSVATAIVFAVIGACLTWFITGWMAKRRTQRKTSRSEHVAQLISSKAPLDVRKVPGVMGRYLSFLRLATGNIVGNSIIIVAVIVTTVMTFSLFGQHNKGVEFFVDEEPDIALLYMSARGNLAGKEIRDLAIRVEEEVLQVRGIDNVVTTASAPGTSTGGIDPSQPQDLPADVVASMQIELADFSERRRAVEIFAEIRERTASIPGIKIEVRKLEGGPPTGKDVRLEVKSTDYDTMLKTVGVIREKFDQVEHLIEREDERPLPGIDWQLTVNREEAGRFQASIPAVGAMIQLVTNGALIGTANPDNSDDQIDIRVRLPEEQRSLDSLNELKLRTPVGQVPISNFISVEAKPRVTSIKRVDGLYAMNIKANIEKGVPFQGRELTPDDKVQEIQAWLDEQEWPDNIFMRFRGADEEQKESGAFLQMAGGGALFLMFIILVTQYNSFYQTFLTLSTVILAIVGVLIGMMITGQKFSIIMTGTGVIALAGIVVNNAIVLIDTYNRLRSEGASLHDAVLKTCGQRMRPIMLTTITTIMGLVPMALSINLNFLTQTITVGSITAIWWIQLSTAVISGLAFSTILTLVFIPVMLTVPVNIANSANWIGSIPARMFKFTRNRQEPVLNAALAKDGVEPVMSPVPDHVEHAETPAEPVADPSSNVTKLTKPKGKNHKEKAGNDRKDRSSPDNIVDAAE